MSEITYEEIQKIADQAIERADRFASEGNIDVATGYIVYPIVSAFKEMATKMEEHERILADLVDVRSAMDRTLFGYSVSHRDKDGRVRYINPESVSVVHHIDEDPGNNDPDNLKIIEQDPGPEEKPPETQEMNDLDQYIERIDAAIKSANESLAYAAPEVQGLHWDKLRSNLVQILSDAMDSP